MFKNDVIELRQQALVNGQWLDADAVEEVVNPATGECLGKVPQLSGAQVEACIAAAEQAYYLWREVPVRERCALLQAWYELIMAERERLARILTLEQGKPLAEALGEITYAASYIQWFAQPSLLDGGATLPYGETPLSMLVVKEPVGVCAAITPWNFPAAMITRKVAPALAAGCTMIVKPAPDTPFTALALAELAQRAGLPAGVLNVITGDAQQVGAQLTASKQVRKLSFTGSTAVGRLLMAQCAPTLKRLSLELGGNAPFIVCADADIEAAVDGAIAAKFRNAGQTCVCANALFVADEVYQPFAERLVEKVQQLRLGSGDQADVTIGPLINRAALHKVEKLLLDALTKGAKLLCGGKRWQSDANWFLPTVLADASFAMECVQEEIFGPVAPLVRFTDEAQLIQQLRQQEAGLAAYVYSQDLKRIQRFARELEVGMVGVNTGLISDAAVPFGGVKASGMGREGGRQGIEEYLETKYIKLSN
ncbi:MULTISPECIES: NAD-dependent succinate-semialdehyde dehydrogenase [Idiomarina]|uniref:NAD-dependent succinate-semialdehyde dehydrogenase n=1 Tax=Idiomarina TaxID=135575 RepID=UPI00129B1798|nr:MULTISPECIES: NAD-dependent succinate-semialdehyde dehydrogenase [Idiomarina]MRJ41302.1 aldehyde dehydrogenase family protein [Idiomarina sp. FeN1]NCU56467.1 aldehyde dehydrogenase family protein [Idiomarina sp. FenA--70]NCU59486.1 aldehyde dehydrogenase family protein [Idiomarina sp. FenBw--71]UUN12655.1 NAD-dependent succinate-semialdehyde dehydrogenase [Idiomarina loihiensis]